MKEEFNDLLSKLTEFLKTETKTETVVGTPFELGEFKCVPVIRVGLGFGFGAGEGEAPKEGHGGGSGAGAGMGVEPIGFLVSRGQEITFLSTRSSKGLQAAFEKVPDLLSKYFENKKEAVSA